MYTKTYTENSFSYLVDTLCCEAQENFHDTLCREAQENFHELKASINSSEFPDYEENLQFPTTA